MAVTQNPSTIISTAPSGTVEASAGPLSITVAIPTTVTTANIYANYTTNQSTISTIVNKPGGNAYDIQFQTPEGNFGGDGDLTYNPNSNDLTVNGNITAASIRSDKLMFANGMVMPVGYGDSNVATYLNSGAVYVSPWPGTQPLKIRGGAAGQVLTTDGSGTLSWTSAGTYTAGTGLTLTGTQFRITNTAVIVGTYGNGTHVPTFTVNQQGQITNVVMTPITLSAGSAGTGITIAGGVISLTNQLATTGTFGNATHVAQVTVNQQGQVTNISNVAITMTPTAGGSNTQVQFNDNGVLNGDAGLIYDKTTQTLYPTNLWIVDDYLKITGGSIGQVLTQSGVNGETQWRPPRSDQSLVISDPLKTFYLTGVEDGATTGDKTLYCNSLVYVNQLNPLEPAVLTAPRISAQSSFAAISTTTGALQSAAGLGVVGNAYIGGIFNLTGAATLNSTAVVNGNTTLNGTLTTNKATISKFVDYIGGRAIDCAAADFFRIGAGTTLVITATNIAPSGSVTSFILEVDGVAVTAPPMTINGVTVKWDSGVAYVPSGSGKLDILGIYTVDGGLTWRGIILSLDNR